jgi:hypothetical protein
MVTYNEILEAMRNDIKEDGSTFNQYYTVDEIFDYLKNKENSEKEKIDKINKIINIWNEVKEFFEKITIQGNEVINDKLNEKINEIKSITEKDIPDRENVDGLLYYYIAVKYKMKEIIINDNTSKQIKNLISDINYKWRYAFLGDMGSVHGYQSKFIPIYYTFGKNPILMELNINKLKKGGARKRSKSKKRSKSHKRTKSRSKK